ncbi:MAG: hypothetical protein ACRDOE_16190, partial [Streptosporangiaceae bacterium]
MHRFAGAAALALAIGSSGCWLRRPSPAYQLRRQILYPPQRLDSSRRPSRTSLRLLPGAACAALQGSFSNPALGLEWALENRRLT